MLKNNISVKKVWLTNVPQASTVEPPVSGHPVHLWEVKNVVFVCTAGNMTKCPLTSRHVREVSAYGRCPLAEVRLYRVLS